MVDAIGYLAGLFLSLCFLPQVVHTFRMKKAKDVSMVMLLLSLVSAILYQIYAFYLDLTPVLIMNGLFLVLNVIELMLKIAYDLNEPKTDRA